MHVRITSEELRALIETAAMAKAGVLSARCTSIMLMDDDQVVARLSAEKIEASVVLVPVERRARLASCSCGYLDRDPCCPTHGGFSVAKPASPE